MRNLFKVIVVEKPLKTGHVFASAIFQWAKQITKEESKANLQRFSWELSKGPRHLMVFAFTGVLGACLWVGRSVFTTAKPGYVILSEEQPDAMPDEKFRDSTVCCVVHHRRIFRMDYLVIRPLSVL
ncbi:hypothetical protein HZH66_002138 [Vespula vulgaris]|uniref:Uncharacterized protein n=2 Tax=Vespula TaxID=7451 RepID=A0A834KIV2_VESVU|nr:hypothetical protein HZH66_002138 [Vespula vulgaris]